MTNKKSKMTQSVIARSEATKQSQPFVNQRLPHPHFVRARNDISILHFDMYF